MKVKLVSSQMLLLSKYCEDLSKASLLSAFGGYFLPSVLPSAVKPSAKEAAFGGFMAIALLIVSLELVKKGKNDKHK